MEPASLKTTGVIGRYFNPAGANSVRLGPIPPSLSFSRISCCQMVWLVTLVGSFCGVARGSAGFREGNRSQAR